MKIEGGCTVAARAYFYIDDLSEQQVKEFEAMSEEDKAEFITINTEIEIDNDYIDDISNIKYKKYD